MAQCVCCKKKESIKNLLYCTDCLVEIESQYKSFSNKTIALWCMCAELNIAFIKSIAKRSSDIIVYIKNLYTKSQARTFQESDTHLFEIDKDFKKETKTEETAVDVSFYTEKISQLEQENAELNQRIDSLSEKEKQINMQMELIDIDQAAITWGNDYTEEEYKLLEDIFEMYTCEIDRLTPAMKFRYQDVAKLELRRRQLGNNADPKESKTIADELKALYAMLDIGNFESNQKTDDEKFLDHLIWEIENTQPAENEDLAQYKNFSGLDEALEDMQRCLFNAALGHKDYPNLGRVEANE